MRKTLVTFLILFALWLGYVAWPFLSLFDVARAAQVGDAAAITQRVDFRSLRRSLTGQIMATYARLTGLRIDSAGITIGIASTLADPYVEKLISPAALVELIRTGWPKAVLPDAPPGIGGLDPNALGNVWQLFLASDYGFGEVRVSVPVNRPADRQFRVVLELSDWTWKLSGLDLPRDVQERLARELMKQQGKAG